MNKKQYKLQVEESAGQWRDVLDDSGELLVFDDEDEARAELAKRYPVETGLEKYKAGPKTTRVLIIDPYADKDEDW